MAGTVGETPLVYTLTHVHGPSCPFHAQHARWDAAHGIRRSAISAISSCPGVRSQPLQLLLEASPPALGAGAGLHPTRTRRWPHPWRRGHHGPRFPRVKVAAQAPAPDLHRRTTTGATWCQHQSYHQTRHRFTITSLREASPGACFRRLPARLHRRQRLHAERRLPPRRTPSQSDRSIRLSTSTFGTTPQRRLPPLRYLLSTSHRPRCTSTHSGFVMVWLYSLPTGTRSRHVRSNVTIPCAPVRGMSWRCAKRGTLPPARHFDVANATITNFSNVTSSRSYGLGDVD